MVPDRQKEWMDGWMDGRTEWTDDAKTIFGETRFSNGSTPSVCPSATLLWYLVCVVCIPKVFIPFYSNFA